jgi:leucyl aminopeptidase
MKIQAGEKAVKEGKDVVRVRIVTGTLDEIVRLANGRQELVLAVEEPKKMTRRMLILLVRKIVSVAQAKRMKCLVLSLESLRFKSVPMESEDLGELCATNMLMAQHAFTEHLAKPKDGFPVIDEIVIEGADRDFRRGLERGTIIGTETNACRRLANLPGGDMTPSVLANEARRVAAKLPIKVRILGVPEMQKLKMGGVLGVGKGSAFPAKFIVMEYFGGKKGEAPTVLVGKGVTFDTGGINLKPGDSMLGMNMDMSGGAAVIHALAAAARLKVKKNIVVLVPAVENMPSGTSYRPGDILRSMSGKTIQVDNTDAEGRIILADALTYAKRYSPALVVDVATLTGAAVVALGERASALFTQDRNLEQRLRELGETSGDYVWPLPLWDEYDAEIKGTFGDVSNLGKTRWGGAITAAAFLKQFADGYPWVHLDIAPRMTAVEGEYLAKGAAGAPVRLLVKLLEGDK